jgi:hypothetical protein
MISRDEWEEYEDYLMSLTDEELKIELSWLESIGIVKMNGTTISSIQNCNLH